MNYPIGLNQKRVAISMLMNHRFFWRTNLPSALDVSRFSVMGSKERNVKTRELFGTAIMLTHDIGVVQAMADTVLVSEEWKNGGI